MAFGDTVNTAEGTAASGAGTVTFTLATAGNLLIFHIGRSAAHGGGGTWGTPTGWTDLPNSTPGSGNMSSGGWYKISDGTETSVTTNGTLEAGAWHATVTEYEGPFAASPLDVTADNETNIGTIVTSQTSGTTGTTAQADELAIAMFGADSAASVDTGRAYTNSFTEVIFSNAAVSPGRGASIIAKKVLSATGTVESTFSTSDVGDEMYGAMATFKKQASATGNPWYAYAQQ